MSKVKKNPTSSNYVDTIREGAMAANIFRGNANGHTYLYFELSRSWKSESGNREGYSKKYYSRNVKALCDVAVKASRWIDEHPEAADGPVDESTTRLQTVA